MRGWIGAAVCILVVLFCGTINSLIPEGSLVDAGYNDNYTEYTPIQWHSPAESMQIVVNDIGLFVIMVIGLIPLAFCISWWFNFIRRRNVSEDEERQARGY